MFLSKLVSAILVLIFPWIYVQSIDFSDKFGFTYDIWCNEMIDSYEQKLNLIATAQLQAVNDITKCKVAALASGYFVCVRKWKGIIHV